MSTSERMIALDTAQVRIPAYIVDLQSFRRWAHSDEFPQRGKVSYLGGAIEVDMSPEEIESHSKSKGAVYGGLWGFTQTANLGDLLPDGTMLINEDADLSTEPDLMFCSWELLRTGRVRYAERVEGAERFIEVVGSPDLVAEIVSLSSVRKDTVDLLERYFLASGSSPAARMPTARSNPTRTDSAIQRSWGRASSSSASEIRWGGFDPRC